MVPALRRRGAAPVEARRSDAGVEGTRSSRSNGSNEDAASVFAYHVYFGLPFPALLDPEPAKPAVTFPDHGTRGPVSKAYGVGYFPTFYVIDPQGRITWRADGEQPDALLKQELERAAAAT